jgi:hypothetical protein
MANHSKFSEISDAISIGIENLNKWYRKIDDTDVYFICLALDPKWKLAYAREKWERCHFSAGVKQLEKVVRYTHYDTCLTLTSL